MSKNVESIPLDDILVDDEFNCRGKILPIHVSELCKDIEARGLIQPVIIAPYNGEQYKYKLVAGFRRYIAHRILEKKTIDCIIREDMQDETEARVFNLCENIQREDLNILQESKAIKRLRDLGLTRDDIAGRVNMSTSWVQIRCMVLDLPDEVQQEIGAGYISQPQVRELHTVLRKLGVDACYEATKKLKDAKILGRKIATVDPNKLKPTAKRTRTKQEVFDLIARLKTFIEVGLWSRCLSWAMGEISDEELEETIMEHCLEHEFVYIGKEEEVV